MSESAAGANGNQPKGLVNSVLGFIEYAGNKLPDPAVLFLILLVATWVISWPLSSMEFMETDPKTGEEIRMVIPKTKELLEVKNQLSGKALADFMATMVSTFTGFHPLGVVLVALLGVGVAEHTGFINAVLKFMLSFTPGVLLTPMLILVAIVSHTAADAGYVLVIPLGGVIFYAAGRHPLAGIAAAFAGVSGGFSANFIPSGIDPLLQGLTQEGVEVLDPTREVNPLCNLMFTGLSSILIVSVGWFITDFIVEKRLAGTAIDGDPEQMPKMEKLTSDERRGMWAGLASMLFGLVLLGFFAYPEGSVLRFEGSLTNKEAPIMKMIVPLIFLMFLVPGTVHGYVAGTISSHRDLIKGMSNAMSTMGYYLVMAFFAALFIDAFKKSNVGVLLALKGANFLRDAGVDSWITIVGIIGLTAVVNLFVGSASAKWGLLSPIFVPMLMKLGISPEFTQAAYRVGDSCTNIITPLMPYFPLVVVFAQRYVKKTGIGTITALMLPYSVVFLITWTIFLLIYWNLGIPLGVQSTYIYPDPVLDAAAAGG
ncbi:MAG: AbgT family transporter [Phycisphaerae bacterium]